MRSSSRASSIQLGSYQLFERIGEGGTSHVHRAEAANGDIVAVKLLAPQSELDDPSARARFDREIRILADVRHPNLVELLDHGVDDELGPYLVMPHLTGPTLRELLAGVRACPEAVLLILGPILSALETLHEAGLVHRDLKPENIMVAGSGQLKLVDLGLVCGQGFTRYTDEGTVVGSVPYMSPEQVEGDAVEASSDLWAVGVMAYEWMAGKRPFQRERPAEEAAAVLVGAFAPLASEDRRCPPELSDLVGSCLDRRPAARPDAGALRLRCEALIDWVAADGAARELAAVVADPAGYQTRVTNHRVASLTRQAMAEIDRGEAFSALRALDRALAYSPDDPALHALCERAESVETKASEALAEVSTAPATPKPRVSRRRLVIGWLVAVALVAALSAVAILMPEEPREETPQQRQQRQAEEALELFGDVMHTVERGVKTQGMRPTVKGDPGDAKAALELFHGMLDLSERALELQQEAQAPDAGPGSRAE